ncbi:hypothetical protein C8J57DRAFT_1472510 [Mycena rebaudengoi]|nr:hypothetical protein C8J57DRAFT_1472510 [Mycena rebaudengoi]
MWHQDTFTSIFAGGAGQIRVNGLEWEQVLQQMSNLKFLTICDYIELTPAALQGITFRLKSLYSCDALVAPWTLLLQNQTAVEELNIHGDIEGAVPVLPALRKVCAPPLTVANLLEHNPSIVEVTFFRRSRVLGSMHPSVMDTLGRVNTSILQTLRLRCPDFLYISHLPSLLPVLCHLILDDDVTWQMTDRKYPRTLRSASRKVNIDVVPNLHTLRLVGARTHHNPSDIILAFRGQTLDLPHLHNIHFCTPTNCYNWSLLAHERGSIVDCEYFEGDFLQTIPEWDQEDGNAVDRSLVLKAESASAKSRDMTIKDLAAVHNFDAVWRSPASCQLLPGRIPCQLLSRLPMSLSPVPIDICDEIASHADRSTLLNLLYLSPAIKNSLRRFLYRHIEVGPTSDLLIATLAANVALAKMVRLLSLFPSGDCHIGGAAWEKALKQMQNLLHLGVSRNVERPLGSLSFRLRSFAAYGPLMPSWVRFVNKHPQLEELRVDGRQHDVSGLMLPALHRLAGNANVVAHLALFRPVMEVEDLLMLKRVKPGTLKLRIKCCLLKAVAEIAPNFLFQVRDLILEDDSTYIRRQRNIPETTSIYSCEHVLTEKYMPDLRSVHVISRYDTPTQDSVMWATQHRPVHRHIQNIHFLAMPPMILRDSTAAMGAANQYLGNTLRGTKQTPPSKIFSLQQSRMRRSGINGCQVASAPTPIAFGYITLGGSIRGVQCIIPAPLALLVAPLGFAEKSDLRRNDLPDNWSITTRKPEMPMEMEWRQSMQGVADLSEEWVAEVEAQWQEWAQKLEDCARQVVSHFFPSHSADIGHSELYAVKSTLVPGSDEYWHAKRLVGLGMHDGEGREREWVSSNIIAGPQIKQMGVGRRTADLYSYNM